MSKALKMAKEAREVIVLFENKQYRIEKIALNYRIVIKLPLKSKLKTFGREFYYPLKLKLEDLHEFAKEDIKEYLATGGSV